MRQRKKIVFITKTENKEVLRTTVEQFISEMLTNNIESLKQDKESRELVMKRYDLDEEGKFF